ncbi:hypothetical protein Tco_0076238, partial [Tanacetum coccineum]
MFLFCHPNPNAFFISVPEWRPVCRHEPLFQALLNDVVSVPPALAPTHAGWLGRVTRHYSRGAEGWADTMFVYFDIEDRRSIIIRDVRLYHITPDWRRYELRAVLESHHLNPPEILLPSGVVTLESTHEFVQLGMIVSAGPNLFRLKLFIFNVASRQWTVRTSDPFAALLVGGGPALTSSGLTRSKLQVEKVPVLKHRREDPNSASAA